MEGNVDMNEGLNEDNFDEWVKQYGRLCLPVFGEGAATALSKEEFLVDYDDLTPKEAFQEELNASQ